jgi:MFS family permease
MLAAAQPLTKPPDGVAVLLIVGEELALIAAVTLMAANFQRNARLKVSFNSVAFSAGVVGATFIAIGTIESLGVLDGFVSAFALCGLVSALLAIAASFLLSRRFPPLDKESYENGGEKRPQEEGEGEACSEGAGATVLVQVDSQGYKAGPEEDAVIDRQTAKSPPEGAERDFFRVLARPDWYRLARHVLILPLWLILSWLSRSAVRRLLAVVRAKVRA